MIRMPYKSKYVWLNLKNKTYVHNFSNAHKTYYRNYFLSLVYHL